VMVLIGCLGINKVHFSVVLELFYSFRLFSGIVYML
jgi:hypothetical protein